MMATDKEAQAIIDQFEQKTGLLGLQAQAKQRSDGHILILDVAPIERFYEALQASTAQVGPDNPYFDRVSLHRSEVKNWLTRPEVQLFQRVLSESLTIGRKNLGKDFFERYIPSGTGYESGILSRANHVVCGRRGAGKSSLLLYAFGKLQHNAHCAWISMQQFEGRSDWSCAASVLHQMAAEFREIFSESVLEKVGALAESGAATETQIRRLIPEIRASILAMTASGKPAYVFLDDFHVVLPAFQPQVCSVIYACLRDSLTFLKISGVEKFTHLWDATSARGLQEGQDIQKMSLDYNLESIDTARNHIEEILDKQASYCGIDRIRSLCSASVIERLVWLAAGVPRDAISAFSKAIALSRRDKATSVTMTSLNNVASLNTDEKVKAAKEDAQTASTSALALLEKIKSFCIVTHKKNAFLFRADDDSGVYQQLLQLVDLRLIHVLHRGLTPDRAAERYAAFLLDYGFYVGTRKARSVDLFRNQAGSPAAKTLRKFPRFSLGDSAAAPRNPSSRTRTRTTTKAAPTPTKKGASATKKARRKPSSNRGAATGQN